MAGYLARKSLDSHPCEQCQKAICLPERVVGTQRDILTGLKSFTGVGSGDVGSLLRPTAAFFSLARECYIATQAQAPTILLESGIARRIIDCVSHSAEAAVLLPQLCGPGVLTDAVARFVRLQLHVMCRKVCVAKGRARATRNRKLLKISRK